MIRFRVEQDARDEPLEFVGNIWRIEQKGIYLFWAPLEHGFMGELPGWIQQGDGLSHMNRVAQP